MRRLMLLCVLAVGAMVVVLAVAGANHSNGEGAKHDESNGTGFRASYGVDHVNGTHTEEGVEGNFFIREADAEGEVTCTSFGPGTGDGYVGGFDRDTGRPFLIYVRDNEEPGRNNDRHAWRMAFPLEVANPTTFCNPDPARPFMSAQIVRGNYIVHP